MVDPNEQTALTRARYDRRAHRYAREVARMDRWFLARYRARLWAQAQGPGVLEVGVGTGANFPYYPPGCQVTAVDLSPRMLAEARARAARDGVTVELREMDTQALDFPDATFNSVVATCVFCSVPDPVRGLRELGRVCRPDGQILLLEHVRKENWAGILMDCLNPLVVRVTGANINRRTLENLRMAGLAIKRVESSLWGVMKLIVARPPLPSR